MLLGVEDWLEILSMVLMRWGLFLLMFCGVVRGDVVSLFDGKSLEGWKGDPGFWKVEDGAITGESTVENPCKRTTYLAYVGKEFGDFELTVSFRFLSEKGNSGIQYRSRLDEDSFQVKGYQGDMETGARYSGILYDQGGRGVVAQRGEALVISPNGKRKVTALPSGELAQRSIKHGEWNEYKIVADGNRLSHFINGHETVRVMDGDKRHRDARGHLAFQLHQGPPMKVQFKDVRLLELDHKLVDVKPEWIWSEDVKANQEVEFVKSFQVGEISPGLRMVYSCDNSATVFLNEKKVSSSTNWEEAKSLKVARFLVKGENRIRAVAKNEGGPAGFILKMGDVLKTDASWEVVGKGGKREKAVSLGEFGMAPWGWVRGFGDDGEAEEISALPGFEVEEVYAAKEGQGSWVSMAFDDGGKLYVSAQYGQLFKLTLEEGEVVDIEKVESPGKAQGLCWAYGSLYMSVASNQHGGVYRLTDTNGDGHFDMQEHLIQLNTGNEHGVHGLVQSEQGGLYFVAGNFTPLPEGAEAVNGNNWGEDRLLEHLPDPRGHANKIKAPAGYVVHFKPDGSERRVIATGLRNTYDIALSPGGSLFGYDADMEWDAGTPWYRPTRLVHFTPGAEFGWRTGTSKWPNYYVDSLAPVLELGPGSPTGVLFGTGAKFPKRYREALFLLDWTFGRIYAVHLKPGGSSFVGTKEVFVSRKPLPVTDGAIGPDGAMYFLVGGRRLQSSLYRVSYAGDVDVEDDAKVVPPLASVLERLLDEPEVGFVWEQLGHEDRRVRYTARVALEAMGVEEWIGFYREEADAVKVIEASVALARLGEEPELLLEKLGSVDFEGLEEFQKLAYLRAFSLCLTRNPEAMGSELVGPVRKRLEGRFPAENFDLNVEMAGLLTKLGSKSSLPKILDLMEGAVNEVEDIDPNLLKGNKKYGGVLERMLANQPNAKALGFALVLMSAEEGWDESSVKRYFSWLNEAELKDGGESYKGFIRNIRKKSVERLPANLKKVAGDVPKREKEAEPMAMAKGPGRAWMLEDAVRATEDLSGASYENGRRMFEATLCSRCHVHGNRGGVSGPNLTNLAKRFSKEDVLRSILKPSEVISEQYEFSVVTLKDGSTRFGKVLSRDDGKVLLAPSAFDLSQTVSIPAEKIESVKASDVSPMPGALINVLNPGELRDLLKFLTTE